jgi:hypothetical protein
VFDEVVDHGPFPLAALKSFNLAPAMASVKTTLVNNDASKGCLISPKANRRLPSIPASPTAATASRLVLNHSTTRKAMRKSPSAAVSSSSMPMRRQIVSLSGEAAAARSTRSTNTTRKFS